MKNRLKLTLTLFSLLFLAAAGLANQANAEAFYNGDTESLVVADEPYCGDREVQPELGEECEISRHTQGICDPESCKWLYDEEVRDCVLAHREKCRDSAAETKQYNKKQATPSDHGEDRATEQYEGYPMEDAEAEDVAEAIEDQVNEEAVAQHEKEQLLICYQEALEICLPKPEVVLEEEPAPLPKPKVGVAPINPDQSELYFTGSGCSLNLASSSSSFFHLAWGLLFGIVPLAIRKRMK